MKLSKLLNGLVIAGCIILSTAQAQAATVTIKADEDTYFNNIATASTPIRYYNDSYLYVKKGSNNTYTALLKFILNANNEQDKILIDALAAGETIESAQLGIYKIGGNQSPNTRVYYSYDDVWAESGVGPVTSHLNPEIGGYGNIGYGWNITDLDVAYMISDIVSKEVDPALYAENNSAIITLALENINLSGTNVYEQFKATEYSCGKYSPYLTITTVPAPEPSSLILGSIALAAAARARRKK